MNKSILNNPAFNPPAIAPVPEGVHRPLWSVMIPTFNCAKYLRQTLESVLAQDPGPDQMQIEVVDDCSTKDDPEAVVKEIGKGRVAFYRKPQNGGAIANFNTCIERSRGHLVHILHGDDYVLPGFYGVISNQAAIFPHCHGFFVRCFVISEKGDLESLSKRLDSLEVPGRSLEQMLYENRILTPGAVVRRSFYEKNGGFHTGLAHVADWEMWSRVINIGAGVFINQPLGSYRFFPGNDTNKLAKTGENLRDYLRLANIFSRRHSDFDKNRFVDFIASEARRQAEQFRKTGDQEGASHNDRLANELMPVAGYLMRLKRSIGAARRSFFAR